MTSPRPDRDRPRPAVITGSASAVPPARRQDDLWTGFFGPHFGNSRWAHKVYASAGAVHRHPAVDPTVEDISGWSTGARMQRYLTEAMPLGKSAVTGALDAAGLDPADVGLFAVASCTGYSTPGIDIHLARDLGLAPGTQRLLIGHMGCYAALPALGAVSDFVVARGRPAVLLCVELASLHLQPATADLEQVVAHALFSDAACAVTLEPPGSARPSPAGGLSVVDVAAVTDARTADHMTWDITDLGFRMTLSRRVPDVLAQHVAPLVERLLADHDVTPDQVGGWAVHPGGPRILDVVGERLGLSATDLAASRQTLAEHGNCSSATVLLVLEELRRSRTLDPGSYVVALAFGPGLTLYATLLRVGPEGGATR